MPKPRKRNEKQPGAGPSSHLPSFGAEAALGPSSRTYRSPLAAYLAGPAPGVAPSQLRDDATFYEDPGAEGLDLNADDVGDAMGDLDADDMGEATGELDADESVDVGMEEGDDDDDEGAGDGIDEG